MPNRPLEEQLRQRLRQQPTPLDTDALWDRVEPRLPGKRKPPVTLWLFPLLGALCLIALSFFPKSDNSITSPLTDNLSDTVEKVMTTDSIPNKATPKKASPDTTKAVQDSTKSESPIASGKKQKGNKKVVAKGPGQLASGDPAPPIPANAGQRQRAALEIEGTRVGVPPKIEQERRLAIEQRRKAAAAALAERRAASEARRAEARRLAAELKAKEEQAVATKKQRKQKRSANMTAVAKNAAPTVTDADRRAAALEEQRRADEAEAARVAATEAEIAKERKLAAQQAAAEERQRVANEQEAARVAAAAKAAEQERKAAEKQAAAEERQRVEEERKSARIAAAVAKAEKKARKVAEKQARYAAEEKRKQEESIQQPIANNQAQREKEAKQRQEEQARVAKSATADSPAPTKEGEDALPEIDKRLAAQTAQAERNRLQQEERERQQALRDDKQRSRAEYLAAEKEARHTALVLRREAAAARRLAMIENRRQRKADLQAAKDARLVAKLRSQSQRAAEKMARKTAQEDRRFALKAAREARKTQLLATREARLAEKLTQKADRLAQRESRKAARVAALDERLADKLTRKANRLADNEARRAARIAARDAREADRLARKADRMAARAARRADRLAARLARREARRLARAERRKNRQPPYWTAEPALALSLPARSGGASDEQSLEAITFQGLVGYHRAKGLSIRSGFAFTTVNSKIAGERTETSTITQQGVVAIIQNPDGSRTEQLGNVEVPQTTVTTTRYFNSVTSLDIPVLVGYRIPGNKFGLLVEAGPSFNLSSGGSAHLKTGNGFSPVSGNYFLNRRMGIGFLANLSGAYRLNDQASLTGTLRIQSMGGGFENPEAAGVQTNYALIGLQVGYRFRF